MSKTLLWIGGIFFAFGLAFGAIGVWNVVDDMALAARGHSVQGTVIDLAASYDSDGGTTYRPVVVFRDDNGETHRFTSNMGSNPAAFDRNEKVTVIYDPWAPQDAIIDSFSTRYLLPAIFGGFGLIFGGIGAGLLIYVIRRRRIIARLRQSGVPINAEFVECYRDTSTKVNGRSPFRVVAQATHPATGKLTSFRSDPVWVDLSVMLEGKPIPVLIDPANPDHHFIDLAEWAEEDELG